MHIFDLLDQHIIPPGGSGEHTGRKWTQTKHFHSSSLPNGVSISYLLLNHFYPLSLLPLLLPLLLLISMTSCSVFLLRRVLLATRRGVRGGGGGDVAHRSRDGTPSFFWVCRC